MYAIIRTGGKQYRVAKGDVLDVDLLEADQGATVEFNDVLLVADGDSVQVGTPQVAGYSVKATVKGPTVGPKITSLKHTPREHSRTKWGHRQHYTQVEIEEILGGQAPKKTRAKESKEQAE
jgi:large subunit ribosomal protein L21